jgi:glycosyltransferase 2 family protein
MWVIGKLLVEYPREQSDRGASENRLMIKKISKAQINKIAGSFLTTVAIIFVCKSVWAQKEFLLNISIKTISIIILVGIPAYLTANLILATAWKMLLNWFGETHLDFLKSVWIYGKSQILKYIPGNLLYLPGRHLISLQHGAENAPLAGAATFEIIGLFATASSISFLGIIFTKGINTRLSLFITVTVLLASLISPIILKYALSIGFIAKKMPDFQKLTWGKYSHLIAIWLLYVCFFFIVGFILSWTTGVVIGKWNAVPFYTALFAFTISWLLGTITPGAPAGAGIRESIIILILSPYIGEANSVLVSLIMRIITMLADVAFYLVSVYLERNSRLSLVKTSN